MLQIEQPLIQGKHAFFASDFHLGLALHDHPGEAERETRIIRWMESIHSRATALFLLGDIFDFWHEYRHVVPKGNTRILGKLASFSDSGIPVFLFPGNHDLWMKDYFIRELGARVYHQPAEWSVNGKKILMGHGDGLGPGDFYYKVLKHGLFKNPVARFMFRWLHPDIGIWLAKTWSGTTRSRKQGKNESFLGDREYLLQYCRKIEQKNHHDYYIFGHRHLPINVQINPESRYINLGDWISQFHYGIFDGNRFHLEKFE